MSDLRRRMDTEAARVCAPEGALGSVMRRANRRRAVRRTVGTVLALAIAGGGIGLAYATFPFGRADVRPAAAPTPSPSPVPGPTPTSDDATPAPIPVQIDDATSVAGAVEYAIPLLTSEGRGPEHGGYEIADVRRTEGSEVTVLFCDPRYESEAVRLRDLFFPDAEIRVQLPEDAVAVRIVLGEDFPQREAVHLANMRVATSFMWARVRASEDRAEALLSADAAAAYGSGQGGLDLYQYASGAVFEFTGLLRDTNVTRLVVRIRQPRGDTGSLERYETLTVGAIDGGRPEILVAERNS